MKKLFFAVALTFGSFMFINAQEVVTEVQEEVVTEVQEEVIVGEVEEVKEATEVEEAKEVVETVSEEASNVAE